MRLWGSVVIVLILYWTGLTKAITDSIVGWFRPDDVAAALVWLWMFTIVGFVVVSKEMQRLSDRIFEQEYLRSSSRHLARLVLDIDKRVWKVEGRTAHAETSESEFLDRLGL